MSSPTQRSKALLESQGYKASINEDVVEITLTKGVVIKVNLDDVERLFTGKRWCSSWSGRSYYAVRGHGCTREFLHRLIVGAEKGQIVDHIDGDTTNNIRANLRVCSQQQNTFNGKRRPGSSIYKGVSWVPHCKKWCAQITHNGKRRYLGVFQEERDAAIAYNGAANELFGEYARLNNV